MRQGRVTLPLAEHSGAALLILGAAILVAPFALSEYELTLFLTGLAYSVAVLGVALGFASVGMLALTQPAIMAIGAYVALDLMDQFQWSLPSATLAAVFAGMVIAIPLGWLTCRLDRFAFAVLGFSFTYLVWMLFSSRSLKDFTGGELGKPVAPGQIFGVTLDGLAGYAAISIAVLAASAFASILFRSRLGRILLTMREDDIVASSMGVNVNAVRIGVTAIVSGFGALGGVLVGQASGFVAPAQYEVSMSVVLLSMALVGGVNFLLGPFIGAMLLQVGPAMLGLALVDRDLFAGLILLGSLVFLPDGVLGAAAKYLGILFRSRTGRGRAHAR